MTNKEIEKEFCHELGTYAEIAISDNRTDGDRLIANMVVALIADKMVNKERFNNFFNEAFTRLEV